FSGNGISGASFNPAVSGVGTHNITYTYTHPFGCSNTLTQVVAVDALGSDPDVFICSGNSATLTASSGTNIEWFDNSTGGTPIATGMSYTTPVLTTNTTYYYGEEPSAFNFTIDTLLESNFMVVDHDTYTGDDRAGIAVTQNYVYCVGDNYTVRYDVAGLTNPMSYDTRDGIFSDLSTGTLYTLWDGTSDPVGTNVVSYNVTSIRSLNPDLTLGSVIIPLSSPIAVSGDYGNTTNQTGVFAGYGFLVLHSPVNNTFYSIEIATGNVTTLGVFTFTHVAPENWAYWGISEFNGTDYSVVYVTNSTTISKMNTATGTISTIGTFNDLSDMASISYSPWNSRWYFHYEGSSTQFGGSDETLGFADGIHTSAIQSNFVCRTAINVVVDVNAFAGNDTTIGTIGGSAQLNATGNGVVSYSWSPATGLSSTTIANPVATPAVTTTYIVSMTNSAGCVDSDTVTVFVVNNTSIQENELSNGFISSYPNPFKDNVNIDFARNLTANDNATLILYDMMGKEVKRFQSITGNKLIINREALAPGIYTYNFSLYSNKINAVGKLVLMD
ncbi:MAG: T9SS type A sorting domain-containing protein, partial [Bacteroidota bacterium]|nr:T9SS type A sorting domain-containing protein [Bacteroidota bacterium]